MVISWSRLAKGYNFVAKRREKKLNSNLCAQDGNMLVLILIKNGKIYKERMSLASLMFMLYMVIQKVALTL